MCNRKEKKMLPTNYDLPSIVRYILKCAEKVCQALLRDKRDLFGTPQTGLRILKVREVD